MIRSKSITGHQQEMAPFTTNCEVCTDPEETLNLEPVLRAMSNTGLADRKMTINVISIVVEGKK